MGGGSVANRVTGKARHYTSSTVAMMYDGNDASTAAKLIHDENRLPGYEYNGEVLQINPERLRGWRQWESQSAATIYYIVTTPEEYRKYGAAPATEPSDRIRRTPVDLLLMFLYGAEVAILHEVSVISSLLDCVKLTCIFYSSFIVLLLDPYDMGQVYPVAG